MDGDSFFDMENDCGMLVDCDDTDAYLTDNCCDEGIPIIDSEAQTLYLAPADEPFFYTW